MKILCDTSILVEIDRHHKDIVDLLKKCVEEDMQLVISTVTVSEILTGAFLQRDAKQASITAKEVLNQFEWKDFDGETGEYCAKLLSYLILEKKQNQVEYPDVMIAATLLGTKSDVLLTLNKKDFVLFPHLQEKICTPDEFKRKFW